MRRSMYSLGSRNFKRESPEVARSGHHLSGIGDSVLVSEASLDARCFYLSSFIVCLAMVILALGRRAATPISLNRDYDYFLQSSTSNCLIRSSAASFTRPNVLTAIDCDSV